MVSGNMPAFSAYPSASQSIASVTFTKLQFNTVTFDTSSPVAYDTTNYRFLPKTAGYYQVVGSYYLPAAASGQQIISLYKNGSAVSTASYAFTSTASIQPSFTYLIYLNGSTDYIELYAYQGSGGSLSTLSSRPDLNYFQAVLVRTA
jgi:hypothetical protein